MKFQKLFPIFILFFSFAYGASDHQVDGADYEFVATVNGTPITKGVFDLKMAATQSSGQKDTPQLREAVKNELINFELLAQEAERMGLDKDIQWKDQITLMRQNVLTQAYVNAYLKDRPITTDQLREEYEKQKQSMGGGESFTQYKLSQIIVSTQADANRIIERLRGGEPFAKAAKEFSIDAATKSRGGSLGWIVLTQVNPSVAQLIGGLPKGGVSQSLEVPQGWAKLSWRPFGSNAWTL